MTTPAPVGTLYVDPATGDAYRLRDYGVDWTAKPFTGQNDKPSYTVSLAKGMSTTAYGLPTHALVIWSPDGTLEADVTEMREQLTLAGHLVRESTCVSKDPAHRRGWGVASKRFKNYLIEKGLWT